MTEDASAGRLYLEVVADASGLRGDINRKVATLTQGIEAKVQLKVDAARLAAEARTAAKAAEVTAKVTFDRAQIRRELATKLAQAANRVEARVAVTVDDARARAELARVARDQRMTVQADADTSGAEEQVERMRRRQSSRPIDVNVRVGRNALTVVGELLTKLSIFPAVASGVLVAAGALTNLAGAAYAATAAISQTIGVLAAVPNLAGVAVQGLAALFLGFSGVGEAVKLLGRAHQATGRAATTSGAEQAAAAEQVRSAHERLALARETAAERVADAEQRLADVQLRASRQVRDAQARAVTAHERVQRALEDLDAATSSVIERQKTLARQIAGGALDEEGAEYALERARRRLDAITGPGAVASTLDKKEADLAYRQAQQRLDEIQARNAELAQEKAAFDRAGARSSDQVVGAEQRVIEAKQDEAEAQQHLREVVYDTTRDIADAQRQIFRANRDGVREIAAAQRALVAAMRRGAAGTQATSAAVDQLKTAMDQLSPAGRAFARFIDGTLLPRFRRLRNAVQTAVLPPLQEAITRSMPLLDTLQDGLVNTGKRVGKLALEFADLTSSKAFRDDVTTIMASNNRALTDFGKAGNALVSILRHIAVVAGPVLLEPFAKWTRKLAEAGDKAAKTGRETGTMAAFFERARQALSRIGRIAKGLTKTLLNLGKAGRPTGDNMLERWARGAEHLAEVTATPEMQERLQRFFEQADVIWSKLGGLLIRVGKLFGRLGEITGGDALDSLFWVLNRFVDILELITKIPGGGALLSVLLTLSGAGLGIGLVAKGLGGIVKNVKALSKYTGVTKLLGALVGPLTGGLGVKGVAALTAKQAGGAVAKGAGAVGRVVKSGAESVALRGMYAADAIGSAAGSAASKAGGVAKRAGGAVKRGAKAGGGAVVSGVKKAGGAVVSGAKKVGGAVAKRVAERGAERGAASVATVLGGNLLASGIEKAAGAARRATGAVAGFVGQLAKTGSAKIVGGLSAVAGAIGQGARAAWGAVTAIASLVVQHGRAALAAAGNAAKTLAMAAAQGVVRVATLAWAAVQWALNAALNANPISLIVVAVAALVAAVIWAYKNVGWFRDGVNAAFRVIGSVATWLWKKVFQPVFQSIGEVISWVWRKVLEPSVQGWKLLWQTVLGPAIRTVWENVLRPVFNSLKTIIGETIPNAFKSGVRLIKQIWDGLKEIAKAPVAFVVNTVYNRGVVPVWNFIADKVKPEWKLKPIAGFAGGGIFDGLVPGYTPGRDTHVIAVGGGEGILRPELTRALGRDFIERGNLAAIRGGVAGALRFLAGIGDPSGLPGYSRGGIAPLRPGTAVEGAYASGGIFQGVSDFFSSAKDWFANGLRKALRGATNPLLDALQRSFGQTPMGQLIHGTAAKVVDTAIGWLLPQESQMGGPGRKAVQAARKVIGTPYSWGGGGLTGPSRGIAQGANTVGFDCSALVRFAWYQALKRVMPRTTYSQWPWTRRVQNPAEGDLGFMNFSSGGMPEHVVMFSGNGRIIEAPYTGAHVRETAIRPGAHWGRPPASFLADTGGALPPGRSIIDNLTGENEWILTPEAVRMLGGESAVAAINTAASAGRAYQSARSAVRSAGASSSASRVAASTGRDAPLVEQHIHAAPRQSEYEIAMISNRKLGVALG